MTTPPPQSNELLSCPFCGCIPIRGVEANDLNGAKFLIKCPDCPNLMLFYSSSKEQAVERWNTRTAPTTSAKMKPLVGDVPAAPHSAPTVPVFKQPPIDYTQKLGDLLGQTKEEMSQMSSQAIWEVVDRRLKKSQDAIASRDEQLRVAKEALKKAIHEICTYHIDWARFSSGSPDYDRDYKPEFPAIVEELKKALSTLNAKEGV